MLLTDDFLRRWGDIVDEVDKQHIPIACVKKVVFRTRNKRQKTINLRRLREQGMEESLIETMVESFIQANESDIASMEFVLDIEAVASQVQPETDKLLKGM
jgi:Asp-tRNA(Asn)/Glu-tRNA(Gln) amidotransferase B subunit